MQMWQVEILWQGVWYPVGYAYDNRDAAEWDIARWRQLNGSNGRDTGFRAARTDDEYVTLDSVLGHGRSGAEKATDICAHGNRGACGECEASGVDGINLGEKIQ